MKYNFLVGFPQKGIIITRVKRSQTIITNQSMKQGFGFTYTSKKINNKRSHRTKRNIDNLEKNIVSFFKTIKPGD